MEMFHCTIPQTVSGFGVLIVNPCLITFSSMELERFHIEVLLDFLFVSSLGNQHGHTPEYMSSYKVLITTGFPISTGTTPAV
jgi:hypothetical protein